jgi:hypothetical protein
MTTPMIDRLKERIAELEMQNTQLQTLLACTLTTIARGDDGAVFVPAEAVRELSGRTITSQPVTFGEHYEQDSDANDSVVGVYLTIDPVALPDFSGDAPTGP